MLPQIVQWNIAESIQVPTPIFAFRTDVQQRRTAIARQVLNLIPMELPHFPALQILDHKTGHIDRILGRGIGRRIGKVKFRQFQSFHFCANGRCQYINTLVHALAANDLRTQQPEAYRFRKNVSGQFVWITMEFLPCRNCCAQNPWATVVVREDAQADHLSEELDFSYSHDTLTGLLNRSLFETDLRTLQSSEYDSMVCTYIDVVGLHEINNHLGHRSGDAMLCFIANAARKFFVSSRIYRIGGDEFVIFTPNQPPYSVWVAVDKMRAFLRAKEYEISVGIQSTNDLHRLDDAMNQAEAAMRQDKQAYYARNGQERQLRGLNEKLERTLTEKRDAEHFLRVLAPKYKSVFVVDLKTDRMRGVIVPDYFQKILDTSGGSFLAVLQQYRDTQVQPAYRESLADLLDYNYIRSKVLTGDIVEHTYKKTDDTTFRVKVTPYSRSGSHIDETLWIFSDEGASLTPPQTK